MFCCCIGVGDGGTYCYMVSPVYLSAALYEVGHLCSRDIVFTVTVPQLKKLSDTSGSLYKPQCWIDCLYTCSMLHRLRNMQHKLDI